MNEYLGCVGRRQQTNRSRFLVDFGEILFIFLVTGMGQIWNKMKALHWQILGPQKCTPKVRELQQIHDCLKL